MAPTFGVVGALFGANALATRLLTSETMPARMRGGGGGGRGTAAGGDGGSVFAGFAATATQWRPLLADAELRSLLMLNGAFWMPSPLALTPSPTPSSSPQPYP